MAGIGERRPQVSLLFLSWDTPKCQARVDELSAHADVDTSGTSHVVQAVSR